MIQLVRNVSTKTGEVISQKERFIEDSFTEEGYKVPSNKRGAKTFVDISFPEEMTDSDVGRLARLSKLMIPNSNLLAYRARGGIVAYSLNDLIKFTKLCDKRGKEYIDKLILLGVMQLHERTFKDQKITEYYINPCYFFAGKRIPFNLYLIFREQLDPILPERIRNQYLCMANKKLTP